jgi:calpain-15
LYVHYAEITGDNYSLFKVSESLIFRDKNRKGLGQMLESKDIIQGSLGDCYFMSAISAIVDKYPELVYRLFVLDKNPSHLYGVRLFVNGVWKTIHLDLTFPIDRHRKLCAAQPYKHQVWVMLL